MDISAVGIPLTFLFLSLIGLWMIIFSKGFWLLKVVFITCCLYFSFLMWYSLSTLSGWATETPMPLKSMIHWIVVQEPSKFLKNEGAIFIWATEVDTENNVAKKETGFFTKSITSRKNEYEPRAYRLPYSEDLHQSAAKAMQAIMKGQTLIGEKVSGKSGYGTGDSEGITREGNNNGDRNGAGSLSQEQVFKFYELPPVKLPPKITGKEN